jgi:hypothetical protein
MCNGEMCPFLAHFTDEVTNSTHINTQTNRCWSTISTRLIHDGLLNGIKAWHTLLQEELDTKIKNEHYTNLCTIF